MGVSRSQDEDLIDVAMEQTGASNGLFLRWNRWKDVERAEENHGQNGDFTKQY